MTKRIIGFLLVLCLIVGLLPVVVLAADETATLTINTAGKHTARGKRVYWNPTLSEGMTPVYRLTAEDGAIETGATADNYNLKVEWPVGGKPTLTMRNANIVNDNVNTSTYSGTVYNTMNIGGTADFVIMLEGTNTTKDGWLAKTGQALYRVPQTIVATNKGSLTIKGSSRADSLSINNSSDVCIEKYYGALTIHDATVALTLNKTGQARQTGIALMYNSEGYEDKTNLTVEDANLRITNTSGYASFAILLTSTSVDSIKNASVNLNTGDILFKNSNIHIDVQLSTGSTSDGYEMINFGSGSTFTIDNCEAYFYARHIFASYVPTIKNVQASTLALEDGASRLEAAVEFPNASLPAGASLASRKSNCVRVTHTCIPGEPSTTKIEACSTKQVTTTHCLICGGETSRTEVEVTDRTKIHTPGPRVEVDQNASKAGLQRTEAKFEEFTSDGYQYYRLVPGKYVFEYTCSVCGETWTEEESFQPAILYHITKGAGNDNNNANSGHNTKVGYKNDNVRLYNPGTTLYYETIVGTDENNADNSYMIEITDTEKIAAGDWHVKFEYPLYGNPVLTLRGANIINREGLWYGYAGWNQLAPLTVVLEGNNTIKQPQKIVGSGPLMLLTSNPVTITGEGSLYLESQNAGYALRALGDLHLDNVDISIARPYCSASSARNAAISAANNLVVDGGKIEVSGFEYIDPTTNSAGVTTYNTYSAFYCALAAKNMILRDTDIEAIGTFHPEYGILYTSGDMTISESSLLLAQAYAFSEYLTMYNTNAITCKGTLTWDYKTGMVGNTIHSDENSYTRVDAYMDPQVITYPANIKALTENDALSIAILRNYLQIAPAKKLEKFEGTRVGLESNLILEFALDPTNIPVGSIAYISRTKDGVEDTREIVLTEAMIDEDGFYVIPYTGIAAKEMHDQITVVVKGADGTQLTEVKSDSIYDYTIRMLRKPQNAEDKELLGVLVAMLNYGTMAQVQFEYNTTNLANTALTPAEWGYATESFEKPEATPATVVKEENVTTSRHRGTTFELKSNITMMIAVSNEDFGKGSYAEVYKNGVLVDTVQAKDNTTFAVYSYSGMVAADGNAEITFKIYGADEELKLTVTDSLAAYVGRNIDQYPYLENLMQYCNAAAAYFQTLQEVPENEEV